MLVFSAPAWAVTAKDLAKFLPADLAGFKAPMQVIAHDMKSKNFTLSSASRVYVKGTTKVRIVLTSGPMVKNMARFVAMKMTLDNATVRMKSIEVAGFKGKETYHKKQKMLTIQVVVSELVMVMAQLEQTDPAPALTLLKAMDLKGLSQLK